MIKKSITTLFGLAIFFVLIVILGGFWYFYAAKNNLTEDKLIYIEHGTSFRKATIILEKEGVFEHADLIYYAAKIIKGKSLTIKSGEYVFEVATTPNHIINKMINGYGHYRKIMFFEGLSNHSILKKIDSAEGLVGGLPKARKIKEGTLLTDTYKYQRGDTKESIIKRMQDSMTQFLDEAWEKRQANLPIKTKEEALILASIIEKETGLSKERAKVASVFVNRLRIGMKLQSDPTVIYAFTKGNAELEREIRKSDLARKSPYNTYHIYGLPPTPIANPGREAILATLNPDETKYLFFVATGNGGHNFSTNLRGHINYVNRYKKELKKQDINQKQQNDNQKSQNTKNTIRLSK
jgi:UPF0755 protein